MSNKSLYLMLTTNRALRIVAPLIAFVLLMGFGYLQLSKATTVYKASARIWVQKSMFGGGAGRGAQPGEIPESPLMEGATNLTTFCEVVQSDAVLKLAYDELSKELPPDELPDRGMLSGIRALPAKDANIISLEFTSPDEKVSTLVVRSVINALMKENSMQIKGPLEETRQRLSMQLDIARKEYGESKERLKEFQNSVGSIDFATEATALAGGRSSLMQDIGDATNELTSLKTKIEFLQKQLGFGPQDVLAVEKISNDEVINHLKMTIASTEVKLIELKSKFQDEHPRVKRLNAVLADAKAEMANRYAALIGKVDPKFEGISRDSEVQHELLNEMVQASTDVVAGESKVQSLSESLDSLNSRISILPAKQRELADLQRQDELATNTLAAVESELQRVKLTESVSLSSSRLQVIDESKFATSSCAVSMPILIAIGLALAGVVAAIQFLLDPRLLSVGPLRSFPSRIVGWYPTITSGIEQSIPYSDRVRLTLKNWLSLSKMIWVTSPSHLDGKTLVARSLAESFAEAGYRVVLLDANLLHPDLHLELDVPASPGLLQHILDPDPQPLGQILREVGPNLYFIPAGGVSDNLRMLSSLRFEKIVQTLTNSFDVLIVDGAPADEDGSVQISECRPNLLVVVRMNHTLKKAIDMVRNHVQMTPFAELGLIVNQTTTGVVGKLSGDLNTPAPSAGRGDAVVANSALAETNNATASW